MEPTDAYVQDDQNDSETRIETDKILDNQVADTEEDCKEMDECSVNQDQAEASMKTKKVNIKQARRRSIGVSNLIPVSPHEQKYPTWRKACRTNNQALMMKEAKHRENCAQLMNTAAEDVYTFGMKKHRDRFRLSNYRFGMISSILLPMDNSLTEYSGYMSRRNIFIYSGSHQDMLLEKSHFDTTCISFPKRGYRDPVSGEYFSDIASFKRVRSHNF